MTTFTWLGSSGNWNSGTLWSGGVAPGSTDVGVIDVTPGAYTVLLNDTESVAGVTLDAANATLQLTGVLSLNGGLFDAQAGTLLISGTLGGGELAQNGAAVQFTDLDPTTNEVVTPTLDNILLDGPLDLIGAHAVLAVSGLRQNIDPGISIGAGTELLVLDDESFNGETIDMAGGALAENDVSLTLGASAVVVQDAAGTTAQIGPDLNAAQNGFGTVNNLGTILVQAGALALAGLSGPIEGPTTPPPVRNLGTIRSARAPT